MSNIHYNQAQFLTSATNIQQCPQDQGYEIAFAGRSNAGKSSAINTLTGIRNLARTSKIPGRTQLINFFHLTQDCRLVDLPGYGFASVPDKIKMQWQNMIETYITQRQSLRGLILLMDIRHPLTSLDWQMIKWSLFENLPIHILLTKADKLKNNAQRIILSETKKALIEYEASITIQLFSSLNRQGLDELKDTLQNWFQPES